MQKITQESRDAFLECRYFKKANMLVKDRAMYLYENKIAWWQGGKIWIANCGYKTKTTKDRLNSLPNVHIVQKKGEWYLNGQKWNGNPICVSNFK